VTGSEPASQATRSSRSGPWRLHPASIRLRIIAAFLAAVLAMLALVAFLVAWQRPVGEALHLVSDGYLPLATVVARLQDDHERVQRDLTRLSKGRARPSLSEGTAAEVYNSDLRDHLDAASVILNRMRRQASHAEELALLAKAAAYVENIDQLFARYQTEAEAFLASAAVAPPDDLDELRRPLRTTERQLAEEIGLLDETVSARITALAAASEQRQERGRTLALLLAFGMAGATAVLVGAVISALRPLGWLTEQVGRIGAGDYSLRVEAPGDDEVALLAVAVNAMAEAIAARDRALQERAAELAKLGLYLSSVIDSLDDALVVVEDGVVTLANAAARRWRVELHQQLPEALQAAATPGSHTVERADGDHHIVRSVSFGDRGVVLVTRDVTGDVRARERLARSERLALVGQMLAQIAHEVRNPLNALSLNAELLSDELAALDPDHHTEAALLLQIISREIERLDSLTGRYLQLVRQPPPALRGVDVAQVLREVVRLAAPEADAAGCTLELAAVELGPQMLDGDHLRQAVLNVLRNAVQAPSQRVRVVLESDEAELRVVVSDDGPGLSDEAMRRASEPFFTTKASGTGLGLAVTRQLVEEQEGSLRLRAGGTGGLVVTLAFPLHTVPDSPPEEEF